MLEGLGFAFSFVIGLVLIGFVAAAFLLTIGRWWSEGEITGAQFIGISLTFLLLLVLVLGPVQASTRIPMAVLLIASCLALLVLPVLSSKRSGDAFERDQESLFRSVLDADQGNVAARIELARFLHRNCRYSEAIETLEQAIQLSPKTTIQEQSLLKTWYRQWERQGEPMIICRWCREETPADRPRCKHCNRPIGTRRELAEAFRDNAPEIVKTYLIALPVLAIFGYLLSLLNPIGAMIVMLFGIVVLAIFLWYRLDKVI